ncbi:MAG: ribosomal RNA small subunit methyltransferase A [Candidatus Sungbacteria bacterium]|uniref:Ribosomal RNA small subunit methyltransferase A n=1 Tax=Candidatus Sungiibacteriota bacterium TaxID=2750080 RepID=A0A932YVG3_9BACT|nr:ribosomal RNA small subunit methyltransferase A [Candidatus Sungbacteria bacterium]
MIHASRRLGQHFLKSEAVLRDIIAAAELSPGDTVLEIGPGTGILTRALAARTQTVIAVEKDAELFRALEKNFKREGVTNVRLIGGDILKIGFEELGLPALYAVVANIPYYLTSRLIRKLLECDPAPERMLLTLQKEVAERITARPPHMNLLALSVQSYAKPELLFTIPASAFSPPPKVTSALIRIADISREFFIQNRIREEDFFALIRQAFQHKRKQLAASLAVSYPRNTILRTLEAAGLPLTARPQELALEHWATLLRNLSA